MKIIKAVILFVAFQFILNNAKACSCDYYKDMSLRQYNWYDLVFKGEVVSVTENKEAWEKRIKFEIKKLYKGNTETDTLSVTTGLDGASCGLNIKVGQTWMIFSSYRGGAYNSGLCSRSKLLNVDLIKRLEVIADKKFVKKYSSYSGSVANEEVKGEFRNGKPIGNWIYFKNGKTWEINRYSDNGLLHGNSEVYYEDGSLHYRTEYENGEYIRSTYYKKDGTIDTVYEK